MSEIRRVPNKPALKPADLVTWPPDPRLLARAIEAIKGTCHEATAAEEEPTCPTENPRFAFHALTGGPEHERLLGTCLTDIIAGLGGDDVVCGSDGDDVLMGGAGADVVLGGPGSDYLDSGEIMSGGPGSDRYWLNETEIQVLDEKGHDTYQVRAGRIFIDDRNGFDALFLNASLESLQFKKTTVRDPILPHSLTIIGPATEVIINRYFGDGLIESIYVWSRGEQKILDQDTIISRMHTPQQLRD